MVQKHAIKATHWTKYNTNITLIIAVTIDVANQASIAAVVDMAKSKERELPQNKHSLTECIYSSILGSTQLYIYMRWVAPHLAVNRYNQE